MIGRIGIIGLGRLGTSLYEALLDNSTLKLFTYKRSDDSSLCLKKVIDSSEVIFICVNDDSISQVSDEIASLFEDLKDKIFVHFSGSKPSYLMSKLKQKDAKIASFHPIQTFPTKDSKNNFRDIFFAFEGDDVCDPLKEIFAAFSPEIIKIDVEQKVKYHAACVISSNLICALINISKSLLNEINIEQGIKIQEKLIRKTIDNIFEKGTIDALSGPVTRKDRKTINEHISVLSDDQRAIYMLLTKEAEKMFENKSI